MFAAQNALEELEVWIYESKTNRLIDPMGKAQPAGVKDLLAIQPDLAVFHAIYIPSFYKVTKALNVACIPYLIEPHGSLNRNAQAKSAIKKKLAHMLWIDRWLKGAKGIIFLCEEEREASRYPQIESAILPNTLSLVTVLEKETVETERAVRLMMLGRIAPRHKGLDRFLSALKALPTVEKGQIMVDIYGMGSKKNEEWVKAKIADLEGVNVRYLGPVFGEEKRKAYGQGGIFCMFSRSEGLPMTLYEASAAGLPLVVTEGSNRSDWVKSHKNGWVLYDRDQAEWGGKLAECIAAYREDPNGYRQKALKAAKSLPSWEEIAKESVKIYRKWCDERK